MIAHQLVDNAFGDSVPLLPLDEVVPAGPAGRMDALAAAALARGAQVTLVAANVAMTPPEGVELVTVETTLELQDAVEAAAHDADVVWLMDDDTVPDPGALAALLRARAAAPARTAVLASAVRWVAHGDLDAYDVHPAMQRRIMHALNGDAPFIS